MANDGVYADDPSEAAGYLADKVLSRKLMGGVGGMELRPFNLPMGTKYLGMARASAAQRMDLDLIPRVAIARPKGGTVRVSVIPRKGVSVEDVRTTLAGAAVSGPNAEAGAAAYHYAFPEDTAPEQLLSFAQRAMQALGVAPGQGWQWVRRDKDQLPD